jgi:hypothetical protein
MLNSYAREIPPEKSIAQLELDKDSLLSELNLIELELNRQRNKPKTQG